VRCQGMNMEEGNGAAGQMKLDSVFNGITEEYHLSPCTLLVCWDEGMDEVHNQGFRDLNTLQKISRLY
jgi:hypothetical protein